MRDGASMILEGKEPKLRGGTRVKRLFFDPLRCDGCKKCEDACSARHSGLSAIWVQTRQTAHPPAVRLCHQCHAPLCEIFCPAGAITSLHQENSGTTVFIDPDACIACGMCQMGCPHNAVNWGSRQHAAAKCDLCGGVPACVSACSTGALMYDDLALGSSKARRHTCLRVGLGPKINATEST